VDITTIERPGEFIPAFAEAGVDWISVHQEACVHLDRTPARSQ
jgi:ribulose-phosphate 3-epimerase